MFESALELLGSAAGGGVIGLAGAVIKRVFESKAKAQEEKQVLQMRKIEADAQIEIAKVNSRVSLQTAEANAKTAEANLKISEQQTKQTAIEAESKINTAPGTFTNQVRALIRPFLTLYLVFFLTAIYYRSTDILFTPTPLAEYITYQVIALASMALTFWFGAKDPARR